MSDPKPSYDAFQRLRTSGTGQRLDVEWLYNKQDDYYDELTNNGTVTHNTATRDLTLSLGDANNGSYAHMQSYPVPYTPGNSQLVELTGVLDLAGLGGGTLEVFLRSSTSGSAVTQTIPQSQWISLSGSSEARPDMAQIFAIDFQSLKVGTIRFGIVQHGVFHPVAKFDNDNRRNSGYWQLANGSCYYKLYTAGGITYMELGYGNDANAVGFRYRVTANASATMKAICSTVKSEGGQDLWNLSGLPRAADTNTTPITVSSTLVPIISIRPKATFNSLANLILALPKSFGITTNQPIHYHLIHDGTIATAVWTDVDTADSMMEYDVSSTSITGGHKIASGYLGTAGTATTRVGQGGGLLGKTLLWDRQDSITGILSLCAVRTTASDATVYGGLEWEEIR